MKTTLQTATENVTVQQMLFSKIYLLYNNCFSYRWRSNPFLIWFTKLFMQLLMKWSPWTEPCRVCKNCFVFLDVHKKIKSLLFLKANLLFISRNMFGCRTFFTHTCTVMILHKFTKHPLANIGQFAGWNLTYTCIKNVLSRSQ